MRRRRVFLFVAVLGAALTGGVVAIVVRGGAPAPSVSAPPPVTTATVQRTDLSATILTEGTLGYTPAAPVANQMTGAYLRSTA